MQMAIEEAKKSHEVPGCGVVLVKDNHVVAKACNTQRKANDASAHAEVNALREAGKQILSRLYRLLYM